LVIASTRDVAKYYDRQQIFYSYLWSRSALHYGFWFEGTRTLAEALANTDRFVAAALDIKSNDRVLDAGCGVGGTSLYIAETTTASVEGITLSNVQLRIAQAKAARSAAASRVIFSRQDFMHTRFDDGAFSKIFGIESVSHAMDKVGFLNEAYRLLRPGGRLVICDGFLTATDFEADLHTHYLRFLEGWALPHLAVLADFDNWLTSAGFSNVTFHNMQRYIDKSIDRIYWHGVATWVFSFMKGLFGSPRRDLAARYQKALFNQRVMTYGVFTADKATVPAVGVTTG
jgi:cyclopropane fatty-acyl-phospholipid synthase-like methyltransferase